MAKTKTRLELLQEIVEYVVEQHEWCEYPLNVTLPGGKQTKIVSVHCSETNNPPCQGCDVKEEAISLLGLGEGDEMARIVVNERFMVTEEKTKWEEDDGRVVVRQYFYVLSTGFQTMDSKQARKLRDWLDRVIAEE